MPAKSLTNSPWIIKDLDVSWPQRTENGVLQRRRQLSANIERDIDAYDVARFSTLFVNAASSATNLTAQIGDGTVPGLTHSVTFYGVWQFEQIQTSLDGPRAHQRTTIWQFSSAWEDVPTV